MADKKPFKTIDEYIQSCPEEVRGTLQKIRETIHEVAPDATETISYGMPSFNLNKAYLVYFGAWKDHIGLYPTPSGTKAFEQDLVGYKHAKGSVRLPLNKPIPYDLIKEIVKFRVQEALDR